MWAVRRSRRRCSTSSSSRRRRCARKRRAARTGRRWPSRSRRSSPGSRSRPAPARRRRSGWWCPGSSTRRPGSVTSRRTWTGARSGGIAEFRVGAGQGCENAAFIPVGTGIAAALLLEGRIHRAHGLAGEVGHIDVGHAIKCGCGAVGCLEAISSAAAIARRYTERTGRAADGARDVVEAARHGDEAAVAVVQDALDGLGHGIRTLLTLLGPEVIVLGGGLFTAADYVLQPVHDWLASHLTFQRMPELRIAKLGDEAGRLGAGLLALDRLDTL